MELARRSGEGLAWGTSLQGRGRWRQVSSLALLALLGLGAVGGHPVEAGDGSFPSFISAARQPPIDLDGPSIQDVRALPPLARPGEFVSLGAMITDPSGVQSAWVLIQAPDVDLNLTLVAFGDTWFLNRSWETRGVYGFEIGAQDGVGNINTAPGSFQVQDSLAGPFGLLVLFGTLLGVGAGALVYLWIRFQKGDRG